MGYPLYRGRRNTRRSSPLGSKLKITATFTNFGLIHLNIWKWVSQSVFPYASRRPRGFGRSHIRTKGFDRCCSERTRRTAAPAFYQLPPVLRHRYSSSIATNQRNRRNAH